MSSRAIWPSGLDETTQRRLILRAVKQCAPDRVGEFRGKHFCFAQLDNELREYAWCAGLLCWLVVPLLALMDVGLYLRIRSAVALNYQAWMDAPDPDCELWVSIATVRGILKKLPRHGRKQAKPIHSELKHVEKRWSELVKRLDAVDQALRLAPETALRTRQEDLARRIASESDDATRAALTRSLREVDGQLASCATLGTWHRRILSAQDECLESLARMATHLSLMAAAGPNAGAVPLTQATERLQSINHDLTALQEASEEVLQLQSRA